MSKEIRILYLEDATDDVAHAEKELRESGLLFQMQRADTRERYLRELKQSPDVILSGLPSFDGLTALALTREKCPGVPAISNGFACPEFFYNMHKWATRAFCLRSASLTNH